MFGVFINLSFYVSDKILLRIYNLVIKNEGIIKIDSKLIIEVII